ncbi:MULTISPECIES: hypothetical protein [Bradyrhizobium]|uniref:hypothetical protein n=1 Tax=Bradyrhizobium TaxID=374 RepID=UPI0011AE43E7|nr:hypothetical protein [Bradyrhizobium vignae]
MTTFAVDVHGFEDRHPVGTDGHHHWISILALGLNHEGLGNDIDVREACLLEILLYLLRGCEILVRSAGLLLRGGAGLL